MSDCFASTSSWSRAAGRWTSAPTSSGRWPCLRMRIASLAAVVVLPEASGDLLDSLAKRTQLGLETVQAGGEAPSLLAAALGGGHQAELLLVLGEQRLAAVDEIVYGRPRDALGGRDLRVGPVLLQVE